MRKFSSCIGKEFLNMIKTGAGRPPLLQGVDICKIRFFQNNIEKALKGRLKPEASKRNIYMPCCNILSEELEQTKMAKLELK